MSEAAVRIAGLSNLRDVGGLPSTDGGRSRFGTLYRSQSPDRLDSDGLSALRALGLRSVLDLRDDFEVDYWPYELGDPVIRRPHVPILGNLPVPGGQDRLYQHIIESCGDRLTYAVRVFARPDYLPSLVHCAVGKDRTGLVVGLALAAAGVTDEAIVTDFLRSNAGLGLRPPSEVTSGANPYQTNTYVRAELMRDSLARARQLAGTVPSFLHMHGMGDAELAALRANLIEPENSRTPTMG